MSDEKLSVSKIMKGTAIDHIPAGRGYLVQKILKIDPKARAVIIANVDSRQYGKKDLIKIEGKFLTPKEVNIISLIAPNATINKIENSEVVEKAEVKFPDVIEEVLKCPNLSCITNLENEPIVTKFIKVGNNSVQCYYCDSLLKYGEIVDNLKL
ncbi:MAG: aspartate carbamoyltransferase regulatory subunit [Candidatus Aenigmarchaeota archaeon]|nr:aspartate carbamoyltransferase regulatory subunit [Candidatus Aenigmarchaeota archaeon]